MTTGHRPREAPALASVDSLGSTDELREQARRLLPPGGGDARPPARQEATDATGAVRVVVDDRARVADVWISPRWRDRLDADGVAAAVSSAYHAAAGLAVEAHALAALAAEEAGQDLPAAAEPAQAPDAPTHLAEWLAWARGKLDDIYAERERVARIRATDRPGRRERTGPHGCFNATLQGPDLVDVTGDARRIRQADSEQLREDALDVLSDAGPADDW